MVGVKLERTNEEWLRDLALDGREGREAQETLRKFLHRGLVRVLAARGGVDEATVEDFTQDALVKIRNGLDTFRGDSKLTTWAMAIATRVAFSELRRARWRDVSLETIEMPASVQPQEQETRVHRAEIIEVLHKVVEEELTARQRTALLSEMAGVPQVVLMEKLGLTRNALYKLIHDGRKKARQALIDAEISEADVRSAFDG